MAEAMLLNAVPCAHEAGLHGFLGRGRRRVRRGRFLPLAAAELKMQIKESAAVESVKEELLACPICYVPLARKGPAGLNQLSISRSAFQCPTCKRTYSSRDVYLDLTITSGSRAYQETPPTGTELFRNPLVSLVYERGWRQNFQSSGFPGPDEELKMALNYLEPAFGSVLVDASCGSGLFTRRFAQSDKFAATIALDFSESMLRQCSVFIKQDRSLKEAEIALVRADVSRLPFASSTIDAIHAGAALHCWPSPSAGVAEICRVLKPGGVFVATTFLVPDFPFMSLVPRRRSSSLRYWKEEELEDLSRICGLSGFSKIRKGNFIMISARK